MAVKVVHPSTASHSLPQLIGSSEALVEKDVITAVKQQVSGYKTAEGAKADLDQLTEFRGTHAFVSGGILKRIRDEEWYKAYGCPFFDRFLDEQGIARSTGYAYIELYERITDSGVCWSDVQSIGWTKLRYLARQINKENRDAWIAIASEKTVAEIRQLLKDQNPAKALAGSEVGVSTQVDADAPDLFPVKPTWQKKHRVSISLHEEQWETVETAFEIVKAQTESPHDNFALEMICLSFLAEHHEAFAESYFFRVAVKHVGHDRMVQLIRDIWPSLEIAVTDTEPSTS